MKYPGRYTPRRMHRHELKPGVTGCAQVNRRNALTWEQELPLDVWNVDQQGAVTQHRTAEPAAALWEAVAPASPASISGPHQLS